MLKLICSFFVENLLPQLSLDLLEHGFKQIAVHV